jgi:hypothetical protein
MPVAAIPTTASGLHPGSYAAALFACNFKRQQAYRLYERANNLRVHTLMRYEEWVEMDRLTTVNFHEPLVGVADLRSAGLIRQVSVGSTLVTYSRTSGMGPPNFAMNPLMDGERQRMDFGLAGIPVPCAFIDFQLSMREIDASRRLGEGLDVSQAAEAAYQIGKAYEGLLFKGTPAIAIADRVGTLNTIYGYKTHPDRNTGTAAGDWGDASNGYKNVVNTIEAMKAALRLDGFPGPYWLYVNNTNWTDLGAVNTTTDRRVLENISTDRSLAKIQVSWELDSGELVMIDPKSRAVQWVEAFSVRPVEWDEKGGLGTNYRVIGIAAPLVKSDADGHSGIAHWTHAT